MKQKDFSRLKSLYAEQMLDMRDILIDDNSKQTPEMIDLKYKFKNGLVLTFVFKKWGKHNVNIKNVEWDKDISIFNKRSKRELYNEYINDCIPTIYQKAANMMNRKTVYINTTGDAIIYMPQTHN